jgi:hypothetical protein
MNDYEGFYTDQTLVAYHFYRKHDISFFGPVMHRGSDYGGRGLSGCGQGGDLYGNGVGFGHINHWSPNKLIYQYRWR